MFLGIGKKVEYHSYQTNFTKICFHKIGKKELSWLLKFPSYLNEGRNSRSSKIFAQRKGVRKVFI